MTSGLQVRILILSRGKIPPLSLNKLKEKPGAMIILGTFVNRPKTNFCWLLVFRKCFSWSKLKSSTHFLLILIFFCQTLVDVFYLKLDFSPNQANARCIRIFQMKQTKKQK